MLPQDFLERMQSQLGEEYPQYLQNDDARPSLTPVTGAPDAFENFKNNPSLLNFTLIFSALIDLIIEKIKTVFATGV